MRRCYRDLPQPETSNPFETFHRYLNQPSGFISAISPGIITKFMYYFWQERIDLQQSFDLHNVEDRFNYILWFIYHAPEYNIDDYFIAPVADKLADKGGKYNLNLLLAKILGQTAYKIKKSVKKSFWLSNIIRKPLTIILKKIS